MTMTTNPFQSPETAPATAVAPPNQTLVILRGLAGAAVGGAVGYFIFFWLVRNGFYGLMIPGALLGLGAGLAAMGRSQTLAILCAAAAALLAIVVEWQRAPFAKDTSFAYFVTHLNQMDGATLKLVMTGIGALCAYWFGKGR